MKRHESSNDLIILLRFENSVSFQKYLQIMKIKIKRDMMHARMENFVVLMENVSQRISDVMEKTIVKMEVMRQERVVMKKCRFIKILVN